MLLTILSGVCLLLWGLRTVKRAVLRGYGAQVQAIIAAGTKNRIFAFVCGFGTTLFLQSSTATALLASSFVGRGLMKVTGGIAVMIGADVGTSIVAQVLSFDMRWLAPCLLSFGIILHLIFDNGSHKRFVARIIMGIGFMLTALAIIKTAAAPLSTSETLPLILNPLEAEPILALLIAVLLTYVMHSSLSAILLFAALAAHNVLSFELALTFMIGANFGAGIIPLIAVIRDTPQAVQIPLSNLIMRFIMAVIFMAGLPFIIAELQATGWGPLQMLMTAHIGFNVAIAILFMPFIGTLARLVEKLSPSLDDDADETVKPRYLDKKDFGTPSVALASATRETLRMADMVQEMLEDTITVFKTNDMALLEKVRAEDNIIDSLYEQIKIYMAQLSQEFMSTQEAQRYVQVLTFSTNLEHAGDVIDKNLMPLALKKIKRQIDFSKEGLKEIEHIHRLVIESVELAQSIFVSNDVEQAKKLLLDKHDIREAEITGMATHIERLGEGVPDTISTSSLHVDIIRDYRRINSYMCTVAYPLLEEEGYQRSRHYFSKKDMKEKS